MAIVELAERKGRVLSLLPALTYDLDLLISWRAVGAMGLAAGRVPDDDPEYVRVYLRRLMWLLNDESGGIGWRAPEMVGEVIRSRPERLPKFVPILISVLDKEEEDVIHFQAGTLRVIGRLGRVMTEAVQRPSVDYPLPGESQSTPLLCSQMSVPLNPLLHIHRFPIIMTL